MTPEDRRLVALYLFTVADIRARCRRGHLGRAALVDSPIRVITLATIHLCGAGGDALSLPGAPQDRKHEVSARSCRPVGGPERETIEPA